MHLHGRTATDQNFIFRGLIDSRFFGLIAGHSFSSFEIAPKSIKFAGETEKDDKEGCHSSLRGKAGSV